MGAPSHDDAQTLWAWVTRYPDGTIGTVGAVVPGLALGMPLVARSRAIVDAFRPLAQAHAQMTKQKVWLREYTGAIDHEDA